MTSHSPSNPQGGLHRTRTYGQATTSKSGRPFGLGTLRISRIAAPQEGHRWIARLSARIMAPKPRLHRVPGL
jgi:hypothetical protein